jgi:hypothetical protein
MQGCSESSSDSSNAKTSEFSPPSWIQRAWTSSDSFGVRGWDFTSNDAHMIIMNSVPPGIKEIEKVDPSSESTNLVS